MKKYISIGLKVFGFIVLLGLGLINLLRDDPYNSFELLKMHWMDYSIALFLILIGIGVEK